RLRSWRKEAIMRETFPSSMIIVLIAAGAVITAPITQTAAQTPTAGGAPAPTTLKTPWGEPDLQGIWTDENDTPLQRHAQYAGQEFFTPEQRAELDRVRANRLGNERARTERGTARDVAGAYNSAFVSFKRTSARTSLIVDPANGQLPPLTPQAQKIA